MRHSAYLLGPALLVMLLGCAPHRSDDGATPVPAPVTADDTPPQADETPGEDAQTPTPEAASAMRAFSDHVRVDVRRGVVEFDGIVPIDCHHEDSPEVYLEVVACTRGTREHEALVMTDARPSSVHAAMLLAGMVPGAPGAPATRERGGVSPSGSPVRVEIEYTNERGETVTAPASRWIRHVTTGGGFDADHWVFAGSRIVEYRGRGVYDADGTGLLISLAMFANARVEAAGMGGATLALPDGFSPEAGVAEPVWIADASVVPAFRTPVVVRLRRGE